MNSAEPKSPWAKSIPEVLSDFATNINHGLSSEEATERLEKYGFNILLSKKKPSVLAIFFLQFRSPVVFVLFAATIVSALIGEFVDSIAIALIVFLNAVIGCIQELKAENAVAALKDLSVPRARILRNGNISEIMASNLCTGDIIVLEAGDYVPADCRILQISQLTTNEAILTGESIPVTKSVNPLPENTILPEKTNMVFASTSITSGSSKAVVVATGMRTEIGRIANLLDAATSTKTPLQSKLEKVSNQLLFFCAAIVIFVAILGLLHGDKLIDVFMTAISLAVAVIPEGLPTVVTIAMALAVKRLAKKNAIVRHLPAVETLGSTTVICTDKTGTLTTGKMQAQDLYLLNIGIISANDMDEGVFNAVKNLLESCVLCSNASINDVGAATGDPTEVALVFLANKYSISQRDLNNAFPRLAEWSFDSDRKRMSVAVQKGNQCVIHTKGAPEAILSICNLSEVEKGEILKRIEALSSQGKRLLAIGTKIISEPEGNSDLIKEKDHSWAENNLSFLGLVALADPPRQESFSAIQKCKDAGIKVVMITGDHPLTAKSIAKELGVIEDGRIDQIITGAELEKISAKDFENQVEDIAVYARVSSEQKTKIIQAWQKKGHIVAMTGDGVNDAPALKYASIGISMGKGGTEVARQASSIILADDNFATIVSAVEEGRSIFGNIRRTIQYLLSGNLSEILIMLAAAVAGWPAPLTPIHLLWINLVTDGLPSLALAAEPIEKNVLKVIKQPSPHTFFDRQFYKEMIFTGVITGFIAFTIYGYSLNNEDEITARTHVFSFLVLAELFRSFASRSESKTFFQLGFRSNYYHLIAASLPIIFQISLHHVESFQKVFKVQSISWTECILMVGLTLIPYSILETRKYMKQKWSCPDLVEPPNKPKFTFQ